MKRKSNANEFSKSYHHWGCFLLKTHTLSSPALVSIRRFLRSKMAQTNGHCRRSAIRSLLVLVMLWVVVSCSLLRAEAFTTSTTASYIQRLGVQNRHKAMTKNVVHWPALTRGTKIPTSETSMAALPIEEVTTTMIASAQQPPLDVIGVDPGQALFWCTIVHWILWDKTSTPVALTFDIICILVTLWDGTVRAAI